MSFKNIIFVVGLGFVLLGCGNELPVASSVNCSGAGMQSALATFKSETDRQAFLKECEALNN